MQMIINGEKRDAKSGRTIDTINPASGELIEPFPPQGRKMSAKPSSMHVPARGNGAPCQRTSGRRSSPAS